MFNQYTFKQKFKALIFVFFLLLITAYKRSFSPLMDSYGEYKTLKAKTQEINSKSSGVKKLNEEVTKLDLLIGKSEKEKEVIQQEIIDFVTKNHPEVTIHTIQPIHFFKEEHFSVITNTIVLSGTTNQLLKTAYNFENQFESSKLISLHFFTEKKNDKEEKLYLKLIFQNYEGI
ncbi:hypothetical protein B0A78_11565 [Flavobacterium columnare NBRC 100251 = ATCC 23463]|uniref:General secretion pathway protein n=1 Tax=Flavobacterium columnare (strain ATCC 49512 / CIP 103533 / TG 44/87) TaxID=1041826 RepID=G8X4Y1_FLACA|nr:hypothetical protein [Flavobacterium columnare]AEW86797.1 hypothetical protein FCOL_09940 [Flavobacterium columnare ATCC 49512]OOB81703.1 hypothetical protein BZL53_14460 [Flavobacterium columnare]PDS22611.1 hypothetical protein B0A78_11565 [Flavobacterium columnare NBRC 100251 = ATCC 23463]GEM58791.1 hypothetical protein FC1_20290 [Flavobacterium columnare NBRC 100251 = ATCC 23463]